MHRSLRKIFEKSNIRRKIYIYIFFKIDVTSKILKIRIKMSLLKITISYQVKRITLAHLATLPIFLFLLL